MSSLPGRAVRDLRTLVRTPAALTAAVAFVALALAAVVMFPGGSVAASTGAAARAGGTGARRRPDRRSSRRGSPQQPRVPIVAATDGAAVVIVKFNDYQCPPCGQTFMEYKPILAKWARAGARQGQVHHQGLPARARVQPGHAADLHPSALRGGRRRAAGARKGQGRGDGGVALRQPAGDARRRRSSQARQGRGRGPRLGRPLSRPRSTLVKGDIAQGVQLKVSGTPTFFMNGMRLPGLRPEFFDAAIAWELKPRRSSARPRRLMAAIETEESHQGFSRRLLAASTLSRARPPDALRWTQGEVFGFLGPNGAGKSTTLKLLMQLLYPTARLARAFSASPVGDVASAPAHRLSAGESRISTTTSRPKSCCATSRASSGSAGRTRRRASRACSTKSGIGAERRLRLRQYSKGMMQRVGLAQALVNEPDVVFLDEPMSGLDPLGRRDVRQLMLRLRDRGCTVFFSSHILSDAEALCSRVGILAQGRLVASGRFADILAFELRGWELVVRRPVGRDARRARRRTCVDDARLPTAATCSSCRPMTRPSELIDDLRRAGAQMVSLNPDSRDARGLLRRSRAGAAARGTSSLSDARDRAGCRRGVSRSRCATACRTRWSALRVAADRRVVPDQPADGRPGPQDHQGPGPGGDLAVRDADRRVHRHRPGRRRKWSGAASTALLAKPVTPRAVHSRQVLPAW